MPLAALAVVLAACSGTAASPKAATSAPAPSPPEATASPTAPPTAVESPQATASGAAAEPVVVEMDGSEFRPGELRIAAGTEVAFVNVSDFAHTVTEGSGGRAADDPFVDEEVAEGGRAVVTFDEVGAFEITCRIHPTMQLMVTIEDA